MKIKAVFVFLVIAGAIGFFFFRGKSTTTPAPPSSSKQTDEVLTTSFEASFEIYTYGTKRIFTDSKYHNKSGDVYLEADDPGTIHVRAEGVTWGDFFATLPMKLTKDCLTTGTDQVFCESGGGKLGFFINDTHEPEALDKEIKPNDHLLVTYK